MTILNDIITINYIREIISSFMNYNTIKPIFEAA